MLVQDRMTPDPVTISPETTFNDAFMLMKKNQFRRLPVVDKHGKLVGIIVQKDLLRASPSAATSLSVYEINYLLSELKVEQVMSKPVIAAPPDLPLEEAARLMIEKRIGCLPIVGEDKLLGIITETDIFKALAEVLGGGHPSVRLTVCMPDRPGQLARLSGLVAGQGGNIYSIGTFRGKRADCIAITMRVDGISRDHLTSIMKNENIEILNLWEPTK